MARKGKRRLWVLLAAAAILLAGWHMGRESPQDRVTARFEADRPALEKLALLALEKRFSKRNLMFVSVALYIAGDLMIFLGKNSAVFLLAGLVITGLGIYGIFGITFAMQPDVIDYSEYKKNSSVAGLIAAFQGFFVKGGMGLTSFVIGAFLKNGGYVANAVQTDKALSYIEVCFIWIPVVLCVIIAVLTWFYKLDSLRSEMTEELESRRRKIANGNERCDF